MNVDQTLQAAVDHHRAGRLAEAETLYRQVLANDPNHFDALQLLGLLALHAANPQAAIELLTAAIRINPNVAVVHSNLSSVYRTVGDYDRSISHARRALELDPQSVDALRNL